MEKLTDDYAALVWVSYLIAALVLGFCSYVSWRGLKRAQKALQGLE